MWTFHSSNCSCTLGSPTRSLNMSRWMTPSLSANRAQTSRNALVSFAFCSRLIFKRSCGSGLARNMALSMNIDVTMFKATTVNSTMNDTKMSPLITPTHMMSLYRSPQSMPPVVACRSVSMPLSTEPKASRSLSWTSELPSPETMTSLVVWTKYKETMQRMKQSSTSDQNMDRKLPPSTSSRSLSSREKRNTRSIRRILEALNMRTVRRTDTPCAVMSKSARATRQKSRMFQRQCALKKKNKRCTESLSSNSRMYTLTKKYSTDSISCDEFPCTFAMSLFAA
mmetsp:Transcript_79318/g.224335  ORF Transcript_79318/g.224335 Transcript_79318/m.224335 type:complete len:282 (-) Transcript_79318:77-922(-)